MIIKYRCWDSEKKIWRMADPNNLVSMLFASDEHTIRIVAPSRYILVLYTGFSDRIGVDIYRGDILDNKYYIDWDILCGRWVACTRDGKRVDFTSIRAAEHIVTGSVLQDEKWHDLEGFEYS